MTCCSSNDDCQPFPQKGPLATRLTLDELRKHLAGCSGVLYSYVIKSIERDADRFVQRGCAPNFQGGRVTLCTCKHRMRTYFDCGEWTDDKWVAGFSGVKVLPDGNALVYIMKVGRAFSSHHELWSSEEIPERTKQAKAAHRHRYGDLFKPTSGQRDPFDFPAYEHPCRGHRHEAKDKWHDDIKYPKSTKRQPALLVGDPESTFIWDKPVIVVHTRLYKGERKWKLSDFADDLRGGP